METTKLPENFSCLEMKQQIQAKIYAEIKDMTPEERVAYFNTSSGLFRGKKTATEPRSTSINRVAFRKKKEFA